MIGLDFLFFGKLRVLLLVHTASRYTFAFPVQDPESVEQDVALTFGKFVREIGLQNGVVTLRCDNEAFLIKVCGVDLVTNRKASARGRAVEDVLAVCEQNHEFSRGCCDTSGFGQR